MDNNEGRRQKESNSCGHVRNLLTPPPTARTAKKRVFCGHRQKKSFFDKCISSKYIFFPPLRKSTYLVAERGLTPPPPPLRLRTYYSNILLLVEENYYYKYTTH